MSRIIEAGLFGATLGKQAALGLSKEQMAALSSVLERVPRSAVVGSLLGGSGTALYDILAGTKKNRLRRALLGAGLGGAGGFGLDLANQYANQKVIDQEVADRASKSSKPAREAAMISKDVGSHGIYQTQRKPEEDVQRSTVEGAMLGIDQLKNMAKSVPGAVYSAADAAKDIVGGGVISPLRELFNRKLQEAEASRIAKNRSALMSNVQDIRSAPSDKPSTAIPDSLLNPPENMYGKYDSANQEAWSKYNKGWSDYRKLLNQQPAKQQLPSVGAPTTSSDIEAMRKAIQAGRP